MSKALAIEGDTKFMTSTAKHPTDADQTGRWTEGELQVITGETISVGSKKVELSAQMSWKYVGGAASGSLIPPIPDTAKLIANPTKLQDGGQNILVDGDEVTGDVDSGNKIIVTASQEVLKTS